MASPTDAQVERLVRALAALPDERASEVVDEAWQQAADNVREILAKAMEATLLRRAVALVEAESGQPPAAPSEPPPPETAPQRPASSDAQQPADEPAEPRSGLATEPAEPRSGLATEPAAASESPADGPSVWYAYAVIDAQTSAPLDDVEPMDPMGRVETVAAEGLMVLASPVPASEFGPEALQERLHDPDWLGDAARRHDDALRRLLDLDAFVPLRFCTIVRTREDLERFLEEHSGQLRAALEEVAGRSEWGLKVSTDPERISAHLKATDDEISELERQVGGQSGGKAYFLEKRLTQLLAEQTEELATHEAGVLHEELKGHAARSQLLPLQRQADELGGGAQMVLNSAYLVADRDWEGFEQAIRGTAERWASLGLVVELSGPWPPYSFVDLDLAVDAAR